MTERGTPPSPTLMAQCSCPPRSPSHPWCTSGRGREGVGKDVFAANSANMKEFRIDGKSEIQELKILGDWAWMRTRLRVAVTPPNGKEMVRSGYTLTILRKEPDGRWVLVRDANLLTLETK